MKKGILKISLFLIIIIILLFSLNFLKISPFNAELSGKELAEKHCQGCHLLPTPGQLPKESWPFVLDWMGNYFGYPSSDIAISAVVCQNMVPQTRVISEEEIIKIRDYFLKNSPTQKELLSHPSLDPFTLTQFTPISKTNKIPLGEVVTSIHFSKKKGRFYIGQGRNRSLTIFDKQWTTIKEFPFNSEPIQVEDISNGIRVSLIGDLVNDSQNGQVIDYVELNDNKFKFNLVVNNYHRLTQTLSADFNKDGKEDLLLIGYGSFEVGRVSVLFSSENNHKDEEKVLLNEAGALCAEIYDFDNNGYKDIMLLTAQGKNKLILYLNEGNKIFTQKIIQQKHSSFGYNHFSIADFNNDGKMDILTVNGNNMEIPNPPLRPYHGLRILINEGNLVFKEKYFFPMHGATKAIANDFDKDGDLDISAISFFPNWLNQLPQTFVYLENKGNYNFSSSTLQKEFWGRWLTMNTGDINGDGKEDIILGACNITSGISDTLKANIQNKISNAQSLIILENK